MRSLFLDPLCDPLAQIGLFELVSGEGWWRSEPVVLLGHEGNGAGVELLYGLVVE